jgi:hypothetical protein
MMLPLASEPSFGRALFLHLEPEAWAGQVLKEKKRRSDARSALASRSDAFSEERLGRRVAELDDCEVVALSWIYATEQLLAVEAKVPGRVAALAGGRIVTEPLEAARAAASFFGIEWRSPPRATLERLGSVHAKTSSHFSGPTELRRRAVIADTYGDEIAQVRNLVARLDAHGHLRNCLGDLELPDAA